MGFKEQFDKIKENWLLIALVLVLLLVISGGTSVVRSVTNVGKMAESADMGYGGAARYGGAYYPYPIPDGDFAPEEENRILTKSASLTTEIERGTFDTAAARFKDIVGSSDSIVLSENVNKYGEPGEEYRQGSYQIKIPVGKYDTVIAQLKELGEVKGFNENTQDITGESVDLKKELAAEEARLTRYKKMLDEATIVQDKITLSDKIFDQERRVAYLKDQVSGLSKRVDYSTVSLNMNEEQSDYAGITVAKFSDLWRTLVASMNALFYFAFAVLPWAIVLGIIALVWKLLKRKK